MSQKKQIQGKKDTPAKKGPPTPTKVRPLVKSSYKKKQRQYHIMTSGRHSHTYSDPETARKAQGGEGE